MWRTIIFLVLLALVGNFFALLADSNGRVVILLLDTWRIDTEAYVLWGFLFLVFILCWIVASLISNWKMLCYRWHYRHELKTLRRFQTQTLANEQLLIQIFSNYLSHNPALLQRQLRKLQAHNTKVNPQLVSLITVLVDHDSRLKLMPEILTILDPKNPATKIYQLEQQLTANPDSTTQIALNRQILKLDPRNPHFRQRLVELYKRQHCWLEAYQLTKTSDPVVVTQLLQQHYQQRQYSACQHLAQQLLHQPQLAANLRLLAVIFLVKSQIHQQHHYRALRTIWRHLPATFDYTLMTLARLLIHRLFARQRWRYRLFNYWLAKLPHPSLAIILLRIDLLLQMRQLEAARLLINQAWEQYPYRELAIAKAQLEQQEFGDTSFYDNLWQEAQQYQPYAAWYCPQCGQRYRFLNYCSCSNCQYDPISYQQD